jgi:hypothetical protein
MYNARKEVKRKIALGFVNESRVLASGVVADSLIKLVGAAETFTNIANDEIPCRGLRNQIRIGQYTVMSAPALIQT